MLRRVFVPDDLATERDLTFGWSDWDPYESVGNPSPIRVEELSAINDWALVAYSIACAEWPVFWLQSLLHDPRPLQFLEAAWAFEMSSDYDPPPESEEHEWKGPVRGPIDLALMTVLNAIYSTDDGKPEVDAALAEQIVLHVTGDKTGFSEWQRGVYQHLFNFYPRRNDGGDRIFVPREVFDLSRPFDPKLSAKYVESFLAPLKVSDNPMLRIRKK